MVVSVFGKVKGNRSEASGRPKGYQGRTAAAGQMGTAESGGGLQLASAFNSLMLRGEKSRCHQNRDVSWDEREDAKILNRQDSTGE